MTPRQLRLLRGAAASSVATVLAGVSHTVGGGAPPHPLLVVALAVFLTPLCALLVGRVLRAGLIAAAVVMAQGLFHVIFHALGATLTPAPSGTGHHHASLLRLAAGTGSGVLGSESALPDAAMLGSHLLAAVLTTALLWRGETLLRLIARWARAALRVPAVAVRGPWPRPAAPAGHRWAPLPCVRIADASRRGPPLLACG